MDRVIKPPINYREAFNLEKVSKEDMPKIKKKLGLEVLDKINPYGRLTNKIIYYRDKEGELWYFNKYFYQDAETTEEGKTRFYYSSGYEKLGGVASLLKQGYSPISIKNALSLLVLDREGEISSLYEDIILLGTIILKNKMEGEKIDDKV